jgi:hypothetical protein
VIMIIIIIHFVGSSLEGDKLSACKPLVKQASLDGDMYWQVFNIMSNSQW